MCFFFFTFFYLPSSVSTPSFKDKNQKICKGIERADDLQDCESFELDLNITKDGYFVIHHDIKYKNKKIIKSKIKDIDIVSLEEFLKKTKENQKKEKFNIINLDIKYPKLFGFKKVLIKNQNLISELGELTNFLVISNNIPSVYKEIHSFCIESYKNQNIIPMYELIDYNKVDIHKWGIKDIDKILPLFGILKNINNLFYKINKNKIGLILILERSALEYPQNTKICWAKTRAGGIPKACSFSIRE